MTTPSPAATGVLENLPEPAAISTPSPVRYRPNRHERRKAAALKRKKKR